MFTEQTVYELAGLLGVEDFRGRITAEAWGVKDKEFSLIILRGTSQSERDAVRERFTAHTINGDFIIRAEDQ